MPDYQKMYVVMLDAAERAIAFIEQGQPQFASEVLIVAERRAEEIYIDSAPHP